MMIHDYEPETGEYLGTRPARENPKEPGQYLIPGNATTIEPPPVQAGKARVFDGAAWLHVADHRGETWFEDHVTQCVVERLGDPTSFSPPLHATQPDPPPRPLDDVKADYRKRVDVDAERERMKYITPGEGMAMTYQEKFANAQAVDDLGETAANALSEAEYDDQFPVLSASVGVEAATLWECAQLVIARYEAFATIGRGIEGARLQGKKAISEAADQAAVIAAYEAITWPTLQT